MNWNGIFCRQFHTRSEYKPLSKKWENSSFNSDAWICRFCFFGANVLNFNSHILKFLLFYTSYCIRYFLSNIQMLLLLWRQQNEVESIETPLELPEADHSCSNSYFMPRSNDEDQPQTPNPYCMFIVVLYSA